MLRLASDEGVGIAGMAPLRAGPGDARGPVYLAGASGRCRGRCRAGGGGFTLLELLIGSSLLALVLVAIYSVLGSSGTTYLAGQARVETQQNARLVMEVMEADLRLAGYGFPTDIAAVNPQLEITAATATSTTFWADLTNASTTLANDVNVGATALPVASAAGMKPGDTIYLINGATWQALTVSAVSGTTITVQGPGANTSYPRGSQVGRPKAIAYSWSAGTLLKDNGEGGGSQPLADGIQAFQLRYFDDGDTEISAASLIANLANIRRVTISLTGQQAAGTAGPQALTIISDVRPRNLL